ncbi:hypothetical protein NMY22_g16642 [Coprinellus aureogranulatus]|nr:hypothetical protein NMY22_g16642 [Coprinellus aureogranulatus]
MRPDFDSLYKSILEPCQHLSHFHEILSTIALAFKSLSISQIAGLLELPNSEVVNVLVNLHAIMQVPGDDRTPITLWHTSLRDFLTSEKRSGIFFASPIHHYHLAYRSGLKDSSPAFQYWEHHALHHLEQFLPPVGSDFGSPECDRASITESLNSPNFPGGCTALEVASRGRRWDIVRKLVNVKADVNVRFRVRDGRQNNIVTALHVACHFQQSDVIYLLLDNGADPNVSGPCTDFDTEFNFGIPLAFAAYEGDMKLATHLLECGADPNLQGGFYHTALQAACRSEKLEVVNLLLKHGADPNLTGGFWGSALYACAYNNHVDCAQALLEHKADPNVRDQYGRIPLHDACRLGHTKVAELLLNFGVDPTIRNNTGKTALQVAIEVKYRDNSDTVQMLQRRGVTK